MEAGFHAASSVGDRFGRPGGEDRFELDRWLHLTGAVPADPVVPVDVAGDLAAGVLLGVEVSLAEQLPLQRREAALGGGVVEARPDPPHRLADPERLAGRLEQVGGVFAAAVGVEDGPGDVTAAHGDGHLQRGGGELGVVMLGQSEPEDPPRGQVLDVAR